MIAEELPALRKIFHKPIMANISGFSLEEYVECCARMDAEEQVAFLEVNISCPNVRHGGMAFGTSPEAAAEVTRAVKAVTKKPVYHEAQPQCGGYHGNRPGLRGRGGGRPEPHQYPAGHAH